MVTKLFMSYPDRLESSGAVELPVALPPPPTPPPPPTGELVPVEATLPPPPNRLLGSDGDQTPVGVEKEAPPAGGIATTGIIATELWLSSASGLPPAYVPPPPNEVAGGGWPPSVPDVTVLVRDGPGLLRRTVAAELCKYCDPYADEVVGAAPPDVTFVGR